MNNKVITRLREQIKSLQDILAELEQKHRYHILYSTYDHDMRPITICAKMSLTASDQDNARVKLIREIQRVMPGCRMITILQVEQSN